MREAVIEMLKSPATPSHAAPSTFSFLVRDRN